MRVTIVIKAKNKVKLGDSVRQNKVEQAMTSAKEQPQKTACQSKVSSFCVKGGEKPKGGLASADTEASSQRDCFDFTKLSPEEIKD